MKLRILLPVALLALLAIAPAALGGSDGSTRNCRRVAFTPHSDDAAGKIRATGLTCGLARDFIRDSRGRPGERFRGFECASRELDAPRSLPYRSYRCTGAGDVIRWRRY